MNRELVAAIEAGDAPRVRDVIRAATDKERRAAAAVVPDRWRGRDAATRQKRRAASVARIGTATARQVVTEWWGLRAYEDDPELDALAVEVIAARGGTFGETIVKGLLAGDPSPFHWRLVRGLVQAGVVERPDSEAYVRTLVNGVGGYDGYSRLESVLAGLLEDEALLDNELWRIFEVDVGAELGGARVWRVAEPAATGSDRYERGGNRWTYALLELARTGRLDRDRLLDGSLDALARDFRASAVGWYAELHEALRPTRAEREARLDRYLELVASPAPAAMKAGLAALGDLCDAVPVDRLARVVPTALTQKQKNIAMQALSLLAAAAERPDDRALALESVAAALGHERPDVQERALELLERHHEVAPRGTLLGFVDSVSPTLRERVAALVGVEAPAVAAAVAHAVPAAPPDGPPEPPSPLVAVESLDELIELAAALLEGQGDGDDAERFLDGVSRLCAARPRGFEKRTAGLLKQSEAPQEWSFGGTGSGLVAYVVQAWVAGRRGGGESLPRTYLGLLGERALEVARRAARRKARPLLAFPTHAGGWVDPDALAEREGRSGRLLNRPDAHDHAQARVRAAPGAQPVTFARDVRVGKQYRGEYRLLALRPERIPAELDPLRPTIEHGFAGKAAPTWWGVRSVWGSWDLLGARWSLTVAPAHPEIAFAGAAIAAADTRELSPQQRPEAALAYGLDRRVPLGPEAWLLTAVSLTAKSADLRRAATDLVVASVADGRFDPEAVGEALAWLSDNGFAKISRLDGVVRDVGLVSSGHAEQTLRVLEAFVSRCQATPHGLHGPVEAMLEHAVASRLALTTREGRAAFERIAGEVSAASKLGRLTRRLLELQGAQSLPR